MTPTDDEISGIEDEDVVVRTLASLTVPSARPQCSGSQGLFTEETSASAHRPYEGQSPPAPRCTGCWARPPPSDPRCCCASSPTSPWRGNGWDASRRCRGRTSGSCESKRQRVPRRSPGARSRSTRRAEPDARSLIGDRLQRAPHVHRYRRADGARRRSARKRDRPSRDGI